MANVEDRSFVALAAAAPVANLEQTISFPAIRKGRVSEPASASGRKGVQRASPFGAGLGWREAQPAQGEAHSRSDRRLKSL